MRMAVEVWAVLALLALCYLLPDVLAHLLQWGAFAGSAQSHRVALTFDDGPGPDTPRILESLRAAGAQATFFVLAEAALQAPELIRQMVAEGHEVALHGWSHRSSWLLTPWGSVRQLLQGRAVLRQITGLAPRWYRPPWGQHNLATWVAPGLLGMRRALWSVAPDDWRADRTPEAIARHVLRHALPGAVVVLHDGGGDRSRTAAALPAILKGLRALALEPVRLSDLPEERSWVHRVWNWWEEVFTGRWGIDTIPASDGGPPVLRVGVAQFPGPALPDGAGGVIAPGAPLAELHFHNVTLGDDSARPTRAVHAWHRVYRAMGDAARLLRRDPRFRHCRVVGGITLLDAAAPIARLGFRRLPARGFRMWFMRLYLVFLMAIFHRQGFRVLRRLPRLKPVGVWMPLPEFLERFDPPDGPRLGQVREQAAGAARATMSSEAGRGF